MHRFWGMAQLSGKNSIPRQAAVRPSNRLQQLQAEAKKMDRDSDRRLIGQPKAILIGRN